MNDTFLPPIEKPHGLILKLAYYFASEHLYNLTNIGLNIHSDLLCDIGRRGTAVLSPK